MSAITLRNSVAAICCLMVSIGVASADTKVKSRQTSGGQTYENTSYIKGKRQRTESNNGQMVTIQQCDLRRNIQLAPEAHTYLIQPYDNGSATSSGNAATGSTKPATKGGVVTSAITVKDTGERKQMFGYTARHLLTTIQMDSTPDACSPTKTKMEFDGWYIDAAFALDCDSQSSYRYMAQPSSGGCQDRYETKQVGTAKRGFAVWEKMTMFDESGSPTVSTTTEVVEITAATLEAALFEVPADFREVKDYASLYAPAASSDSTSPTTDSSSSSGTTTPSTQNSKPNSTPTPEPAPKKENIIKRKLRIP